MGKMKLNYLKNHSMENSLIVKKKNSCLLGEKEEKSSIQSAYSLVSNYNVSNFQFFSLFVTFRWPLL